VSPSRKDAPIPEPSFSPAPDYADPDLEDPIPEAPPDNATNSTAPIEDFSSAKIVIGSIVVLLCVVVVAMIWLGRNASKKSDSDRVVSEEKSEGK
jgi:hypothetical protein